MTPEKIYIEEGCSEPKVGFVSPAWDKPKETAKTIEYIRADVVRETVETAEDHAYFGGSYYEREAIVKKLELLHSAEGEASCDPYDEHQNGIIAGIQKCIDLIKGNQNGTSDLHV